MASMEIDWAPKDDVRDDDKIQRWLGALGLRDALLMRDNQCNTRVKHSNALE